MESRKFLRCPDHPFFVTSWKFSHQLGLLSIENPQGSIIERLFEEIFLQPCIFQNLFDETGFPVEVCVAVVAEFLRQLFFQTIVCGGG